MRPGSMASGWGGLGTKLPPWSSPLCSGSCPARRHPLRSPHLWLAEPPGVKVKPKFRVSQPQAIFYNPRAGSAWGAPLRGFRLWPEMGYPVSEPKEDMKSDSMGVTP